MGEKSILELVWKDADSREKQAKTLKALLEDVAPYLKKKEAKL